MYCSLISLNRFVPSFMSCFRYSVSRGGPYLNFPARGSIPYKTHAAICPPLTRCPGSAKTTRAPKVVDIPASKDIAKHVNDVLQGISNRITIKVFFVLCVRHSQVEAFYETAGGKLSPGNARLNFLYLSMLYEVVDRPTSHHLAHRPTTTIHSQVPRWTGRLVRGARPTPSASTPCDTFNERQELVVFMCALWLVLVALFANENQAASLYTQRMKVWYFRGLRPKVKMSLCIRDR